MPDFSFGGFRPVEINGLADFYASGEAENQVTGGRLKNQSLQQDLTDRGTLRGLAPGLAAGDPMASATAATLPQAGGAHALSGLAAMHADDRAALGQTLGVTGSISGAILSLPPEQRAAAWAQLRPTMVQAGAVKTPETYPGDAYLMAHRAAALSTQQQIEIMGQVPSTDPYRTPLSAPAGPRVGPGGVVGGQGQPGSQPGGFINQMDRSESGGQSGIVNRQGYAGNFQFGAPRLQDLGLYRPAAGEIDGNGRWNGQMAGTFSIPGFPDVKTKADFLANPQAQRAAMGVHVGDIDQAIAGTPGADKLDPNGLRAVAHLGGVAGMQRFVSSGGLYNPADSNGTHLSDYYRKFSGAGGSAALAADHGHPDGPLPAAPAGAPAPGVQYATRGAVPGESVTDASPGIAPGVGPRVAAPGPSGDGVDTVMARLRGPMADAPVAAPGGGAVTVPAGMPAVANPNGLLATAQGGAPVSAPPNVLAGAAPQSQPAPTAALGAGGGQILYKGGQPLPAAVPGYVQTVMPDGSRGMVPMPGMPPKIKTEKAGDQLINIDERTGAEVGPRIQVPSTQRVTTVNGPNGIELHQGPNVIGTVPYSGRPEQAKAYADDRTRVDTMTANAAAAQASMPRLNAMADIVSGLSTGTGGEARAKGAVILQSMGVAPETIQRWTGMSSGAAAQEFIKLAISTAGSAAKADVGSNNGIQSTQLYMEANPNLKLLPEANRQIVNMLRVAAQSTQDYSQATLDHFGNSEKSFLAGGKYEPLTNFNKDWLAQNNPQVYAAATGILNGDPFDKWSARISMAERSRAAEIVSRIDPNTQIPVPGGGMRSVKDVLAHLKGAAQ
jgi:hypothetical protein